MQTIILTIVLFYQGAQPHHAVPERTEYRMPTMDECWRQAKAIAASDVDAGADEIIGIGAGCSVIGRATTARR